MILHNEDPVVSALSEGIVVGILATIRELKLVPEKKLVTQVLQHQQDMEKEEIDYWLNWFGIED